jgi:hypothetical protein
MVMGWTAALSPVHPANYPEVTHFPEEAEPPTPPASTLATPSAAEARIQLSASLRALSKFAPGEVVVRAAQVSGYMAATWMYSKTERSGCRRWVGRRLGAGRLRS